MVGRYLRKLHYRGEGRDLQQPDSGEHETTNMLKELGKTLEYKI